MKNKSHCAAGLIIWPFQAASLAGILCNSGKRIVFTNGCFDILHLGHVRYLQEAAALGDYLMVGVNTDASVRRVKGPGRPINGEIPRAELVAALGCVDCVILFDDSEPTDLIERIKPDVLVKGGDNNVDEIPGREYARETKVLTYLRGFSTTGIVEKCKKS